MDKKEALEAIEAGHRVKLPEWVGYWEKGSGYAPDKVVAVTKEGDVKPAWTEEYFGREDWQITDGKYGGVELMHIFIIARMCHESNREWCAINGDSTQQDWYMAQEWQRESMIKGVIFQLENPDAPASASHEAGLQHKSNEGWTYGPEKDPVRLLHPCIVPFDQLPLVQQAKDALFKGIVAALKKVYVPL